MKSIITSTIGPRLGGTDPLSFYSRFTGVGILSDRFGRLNRYSPLRMDETVQALPTVNGPSDAKALHELLDNAAAGIITRGQDIYVSWSGGVDSTSLVCSFLRNGIERERLHVCYSASSEAEYPEFFSLLRREGVTLCRISGMSYIPFYEDVTRHSILCMGWGADQLFGSNVNNSFPGCFFTDWREFYRSKGAEDITIQQLEAAFGDYGLPIKTAGQANWWLNFSCKWGFVTNTLLLDADVCAENVENPFTGQAFQDWAMARSEKVGRYPPEDTAHYKEELKQYIHEYTKDDTYLLSKGKEDSWGKLKTDTHSIFPIFGWKDSTGYHRASYHTPVATSRYAVTLRRMSHEIIGKYVKDHQV